eukprot:g648.t1
MDIRGLERSSAPQGRLKHVQFSIMSEDIIKSMSVTQKCKRNGVEIPAGIFDHDTDPEKLGGVNDKRMGTLRGDPCVTCKGDKKSCPGHFGHIELARPVFHCAFFSEIMYCLDCVCHNCSRLKVHPDDPELKLAMKSRPQNRLKTIAELCRKRKICNPVLRRKKGDVNFYADDEEDAGCHQPQPSRHSVKKAKMQIIAKFEKSDDHPQGLELIRDPRTVRTILRDISSETRRILGFSEEFCKPEWMIIKALPVPPPHVRPSVEMDNADSQDDLTHKLQAIIKANNKLHEAVANGDPEKQKEELVALLQWEITTFFDNTIAGMNIAQTKKGRPLKTIRQRIVGKEGRVRGNLMGKRVDFSARSVITPDPNLDLDQVGVPRTVAMTLTFPERVTSRNINKMHQLVRNGPDEYPGANYVIYQNGLEVRLKSIPDLEGVNLAEGDIVERHIVDDDIVLFNRQPSLHKMSLMGHRVKVLPYSTFRLNLSVTAPYNADFDGDEMNLHVPQTYQARAEVNELMMVHKNIVSAQGNSPVMGIIQDTLLAVSKYTKRDVLLERAMVYNLLLWTENWKGRIPKPAVLLNEGNRYRGNRRMPPRGLWTGKQLFSMLLPDNLFLDMTNKLHGDEDPTTMTPRDTRVLIQGGELMSGIIDKASVGTSNGGIIHLIMNDCGPKHARAFIGSVQKQINYWLLHRGFTVGVGDTIADEATLKKVDSGIKEAEHKMEQLIAQLKRGELKTNPGRSLIETFEQKAMSYLNEARDTAGNASTNSLDDSNNFKAMVSCGSKGKTTNISQICALVGQQAVSGGRIPFGFNKRSLPHFHKDDLSGDSRGFVKNSYLKGLTPREFFFHAMGGREGLIDTAVKTSETGYIQRRLVKSLEDVVVKYDGTVRNSEGMIIQFLYGEDGMDGRWIETQKINLLNMNLRKLERVYKHSQRHSSVGRDEVGGQYMDDRDIAVLEQTVKHSAWDKMTKEFAQIEKDCDVLSQIATSRDLQDRTSKNYHLPVNVDRMVTIAMQKQRMKDRKLPKGGGVHLPKTGDDVSKAQPSQRKPLVEYIIEEVRKLLTECIVVPGRDELSREAQVNATRLFGIMVRSKLASKRVMAEYKLKKEVFDELIGGIKSRFYQAIVSPNEMVGVIAAQSIGEPTTQMTLNTFHLAGVQQNVTAGVPRLKEIIDVTSNMKTPQMTVYLPVNKCNDEEMAQTTEGTIGYSTLGSFVVDSEIWYDPLFGQGTSDARYSTVIDADKRFMEEAAAGDLIFSGEDADLSTQLRPWVLRLKLDQAKRNNFLFGVEDKMHLIKTRIEASILDTDVFVYTSDDNYGEGGFDYVWIRLKRSPEEADSMDMDDDVDGQGDDDLMMDIEDSIMSGVVLRGIKGVAKVFRNEDKKRLVWKKHAGFVKDPEWTITTDGSNLLELLGQETVDFTRCVSNNPGEVCSVLGIEAARRSVMNEIRAVLKGTSYVNYRHLALLCDIMTCRGYIMPITRHGINRTDAGALRQCSYEETVEIVMRAAAQARKDRMMGVTENVMLGQLCPMGTGDMDCMLDVKMHAAEAPVTRLGVFGDGTFDNNIDGSKPLPTPIMGTDSYAMHHNMEFIEAGDAMASSLCS